MIKYKCKWCKKEFVPKIETQRYCCSECSMFDRYTIERLHRKFFNNIDNINLCKKCRLKINNVLAKFKKEARQEVLDTYNNRKRREARREKLWEQLVK